MPPPHGPRRARIAFSDAAAKQLDAITSEAELPALDRALIIISVDPDAGEPLPGDSSRPRLQRARTVRHRHECGRPKAERVTAGLERRVEGIK